LTERHTSRLGDFFTLDRSCCRWNAHHTGVDQQRVMAQSPDLLGDVLGFHSLGIESCHHSDGFHPHHAPPFPFQDLRAQYEPMGQDRP
jgi:hypothetical protein